MKNRTNDKELSGNLEFQIIDWFIPYAKHQFYRDEYSRNNYDINIYGTTANEESVMCVVEGFKPYFYVRAPLDLTKNQVKKRVSRLLELLETGCYKYRVKKFKREEYEERTGLSEKDYENLSIKTVKKKDFWGYSDTPRIFLKVITGTLNLFRNMQSIIETFDQKDGGNKWILYEANMQPFIRFIHELEIKPSGWLSVDMDNVKEINDDTNCNYSFIATCDQIQPVKINTIAPMLIASFDIECTSSHGDFPMAIKDYKRLAQDFCENAEDLLDECLLTIIKTCFVKDVYVDGKKINMLHAKTMPTPRHIKNISAEIEEIEKCLEKISNRTGLKQHEIQEIECRINSILTKSLPPLYGDPIIQIGTTFHVYGSDEIVYKHLVNLGSCDKIEGVDVVSCSTEAELLLRWKEMIMNKNPDILCGYNIMGFDFKYMYDRCLELQCLSNFIEGFGKSSNIDADYESKTRSSSAMGEVNTYCFKFEGILIIDMMIYVKSPGVLTLDSYKLDNVAEHILGDKKVDLKANDIFKKYLGSSSDRAEIGVYCIQDCALVNRLIQKMRVIENNMGMSNVCLVPMSYIFHRGQGIKIHSLVMYECSKRGQVIPCRTYSDDGGYEGAIVLKPKTGIYVEDPIVVFDYSSLYPSSMIAENLSHDSYIKPEEVSQYVLDGNLISNTDDNLVLNIIEVDGVNHYYVKYKDGTKSTVPQILEMLIKQRKLTRSKIGYQTITLSDGNQLSGIYNQDQNTIKDLDTGEITTISNDVVSTKDTYNEFEKAVFDSLQLAYKITANSLYGQTGAKTSPIYLKSIAECTTATGRQMIIKAKKFVETNYNADVIYGDSVMPYTPIITLNDHSHIEVKTFDSFENNYTWTSYDQFIKDGEQKQQIYNPGFRVWTDKGWASVIRIIRHKTRKRIYRVITYCGMVDVTEDHSLLDYKRKIIKPNECCIGSTRLLCSSISNNIYIKNNCDQTNDSDIEFSFEQNNTDQQLFACQKMLNLQLQGYICEISSKKGYIVISAKKPTSEYHLYSNTVIDSQIIHESYDGYVYDIETEHGVFNAGIGNIILKNTDSIFCKFPLKNKGKEAVPEAIKIGLEVEKEIAKVMKIHKPQALNYEKVLYPFILFSKKRYVGLLYETDPNKCKEKSMGIALKRRDYSRIMKDVYGAVIHKILWDNDLKGSFDELDKRLTKLVNGEVELDSLIISKTLKSTYKDPEKIAHKVLADRMGARDPGNKPQINDRLPYIYIKTENKKSLQGDRIEHPDFVRANPNIKPDYEHYIKNQIMNPVIQLYSLCVESIPGYNYPPNYWELQDEKLKQKEMYRDNTKRANRIEALKEQTVQKFLFDAHLKTLEKISQNPETENKKISGNKRTIVEIDHKCKKDELQNIECNVVIKSISKTKTLSVTIDGEKTDIAMRKDNIHSKETHTVEQLLKFMDKNYDKYVTFNIKGLAKLAKDFQDIKQIYTDETRSWIDINASAGVIFNGNISKYFHRINIVSKK